MTDRERIERLEHQLGVLAGWTVKIAMRYGGVPAHEAARLYEQIHAKPERLPDAPAPPEAEGKK